MQLFNSVFDINVNEKRDKIYFFITVQIARWNFRHFCRIDDSGNWRVHHVTYGDPFYRVIERSITGNVCVNIALLPTTIREIGDTRYIREPRDVSCFQTGEGRAACSRCTLRSLCTRVAIVVCVGSRNAVYNRIRDTRVYACLHARACNLRNAE